jgi:hypothetical protein
MSHAGATAPELAATYIVECYTPGVTRTDVMAAAARARAASGDLRAMGRDVEYMSALLMPGDEVVFHLFRAGGAEAVHEASTRANLGFERVIELMVVDEREEMAQ